MHIRMEMQNMAKKEDIKVRQIVIGDNGEHSYSGEVVDIDYGMWPIAISVFNSSSESHRHPGYIAIFDPEEITILF